MLCCVGPLHGCGGLINASTDTTIRSLDIDQDGFYEHNLECVWQIFAPEDRLIVLQFLSFDVQGAGLTCYDTLEVGSNI